MQNCNECRRLEILLQESRRDYLAAANRYNTLLHTSLDHSWAAKALRTAMVTYEEWQLQFDRHAETHTQPFQRVAAGV